MRVMTVLNLIQPAAMHAWSQDGPGEWWWLWRLLMLLVWIVVIFFVVRFVVRGRHRDLSPMDRARGVLAERYARGEIDAEEYRQRSETLK
jgi:putative membrane protein